LSTCHILYISVLIVFMITKSKVKVPRDRPRWP